MSNEPEPPVTPELPETPAPPAPPPVPETVGEKLRAARLAKWLDLADIATRTRIPQRHLEAIEESRYTGLPSITYAMGFVKSYARAVELDAVALGKELRTELADLRYERTPPTVVYQTSEAAQRPPRGVVTVGVVLALLVLIGVGVWYGTSLFRAAPAADTAPLGETPAPAAVAPAAPPAPANGQVTLTATDSVWVRFYDAKGKTLFEKVMQPGDRYDVPPDADGPMINVGRPDRLKVMVNGSLAPPLGDGKHAIKDVGVSAKALLARTPGTDR